MKNIISWIGIGCLFVFIVWNGMHEKAKWRNLSKAQANFHRCLDSCAIYHVATMWAEMCLEGSGVNNQETVDKFEFASNQWRMYDDSARYYVELEDKFSE